MKRMLLMPISCLFFQIVVAQKTAFSVGIDGNISFFRGHDANSSAFILLSDVPGPATPDATVFPYGKKPGLGGTIYITFQKVNKKGWITGILAGYETITSKVKITQVESRIVTPANGTSKIMHTFINLFPYTGKRFGSKTNGGCAFDIDLGVDIGITLSAHEKGKTQTNGGNTIITDMDHRKQSVDFRPRLQFRLQKKHVGFQSSFSAGLTNYFGNPAGTEFKAYTNVLRLGVFYTL